MEPGAVVLVKNNETDRELVLRWARKEYKIPPKKIGHVPFEAVCIKFGDPRSMPHETKFMVGEHPYFIPSRVSELRRLSIHYGKYEEHEAIKDVAHNVTIKTLDRKDIIPVYLDPDGKTAEPVSSNISSGDLQTQMHMLRQQLLRLEQLTGLEQGKVTSEDLEENFEDLDMINDEEDEELETDLPPALAGFANRGTPSVKQEPKIPLKAKV